MGLAKANENATIVERANFHLLSYWNGSSFQHFNIISMLSEDIRTKINLSGQHLRDRDTVSALLKMEEANKEVPNSIDCKINLSAVHFTRKEFPEAQKQLEEFLQIDPFDVRIHYNMMALYLALGDRVSAAKSLKMAISSLYTLGVHR